nr:ABC transporter ATP-binding protein [Peristeroidobacter soli]
MSKADAMAAKVLPLMPEPTPSEPLVEVRDLRIQLRSRDGARLLNVVNGVSFPLHRGRTLGIVGESGCGKSTTALALMGLLPGSARVAGGQVQFAGENLLAKSEKEMRELRGAKISMIFQDPMVALDPLFTIGDQLAEPLERHLKLSGAALRERQVSLLQAVSIPSPETRLGQYPHQMSGGMLQRVVGAIAIACNPALLIADEPTTALDPTAQAQFLDLLARLRDTYQLALIVVTHDFGVTARLCDDVLVMYAGSVVERGPVREIFDHPRHPYTQALLAAIPQAQEDRQGRLRTIEGQPPDLARLPQGCAFAPRCPNVRPKCHELPPPLREMGDGHVASCWRAGEV